jgi:glutathione S-transferase
MMVHTSPSRLQSAGIWRGLQPEPNLLGRDVREQAEWRGGIVGWNSNCSLQSRAPARIPIRSPEYGEAQRAIAYQRLERMDQELDGPKFVAGDRFTIADITPWWLSTLVAF